MNKTMRDVRNLINSKKFVDNVSLISIRGIDYLLVGSRAKAISTWNWAFDQVNALETLPEVQETVIPEDAIPGGVLSDQELAELGAK